MAAQRIAVIGAGAVGGVLAAAAHAAGHEVTVCVRTPFDELVIEDPDGSSELPVAIETDPQRLGPVDWVLLTTKVQDIASAEGWLRAADGPKTPVVAVQNGIEHHASLAPFGLRSPVLPALLYGGAERLRPGYVVRRSPISLVVPACELAERFAGLLSGPNVRTTEDFRSAAWRKLLTNLGANPISALTMRRLDVFAEPGTRELLRAVLSEAVAVARAEGAELDEGDVDRSIEAFGFLVDDSTGTSMLYDRLAGLGTEHEAITGVLVRAARHHGIPVPRNETLLALLRALPENSPRPPG